MPRPPFEPSHFARYLENSSNYASDTSQIFEWTGTHWRVVEEKVVKRLALQWIASDGRGSVSSTNAHSAYKTAVLWVSNFTEPANDIAVIPVKNGYLHVNNGLTLKSHEKSLGIQYVLMCDFDPSAPAPEKFNHLVARILPDPEVRARVQEYIGYTLLPDTRFQRAQIWLGSGANGKGTLANIVQAIHERTAAIQLDMLEGLRLASLIGASLIYCDEAPQRNINEQALKSLIAGELVQIDKKYCDPVTTRVNGKWLILANHIPTIADQSTGFWRRFDIVPFSVEVPERERDPLLARFIITHELSGVLNWALEGLERLLARGRFDDVLPEAMRTASQSARAETNSVQAWNLEFDIRLTETIKTSKAKVYTHYAAWCRENGMVPVSSPKFWRRLPDSTGPIVMGRDATKNGYVRTCNIKL